jgi:hypothetical protein
VRMLGGQHRRGMAQGSDCFEIHAG